MSPAGPIAVVLVLQVISMALFAYLVIFSAMGRDCDACTVMAQSEIGGESDQILQHCSLNAFRGGPRGYGAKSRRRHRPPGHVR